MINDKILHVTVEEKHTTAATFFLEIGKVFCRDFIWLKKDNENSSISQINK